ncbi:peptide chain release factor N(5)-glutamine methyltransferase [Sphingobacterium alkalisoli]|uniref:Peptide chain release factor N(5)-glutamine methyltransferase n=1 Tax=Sphingobacterium alkalisoli TaxID=1874115 RepID=A0A4U0H5T1_9SPHI|nr:peptide chain release factor N(5)-glutamine methyltransferase [Sphingobacterium alkalisoli]TJY67008.1 peptide chain release factor N(5)-glutamine methyltransferase [Sphingobacterium alkalisoli]GGH12815.1 release factor glutamine methyltransferase [Sphingobacterium alkalisoli]
MNTWRDIERAFLDELSNLYDSAEINAIFYIAIEHIGHLKKGNYLIEKNNSITPDQQQQLIEMLDQLKKGRPIQHLTNTAHFYGIEFNVDKHTLIPRPETEELVDLIVKTHRTQRNLHLIDIGTGTGCIPISVAKHLKDAQIWAIDISSEALEIAKKNAEKHAVTIQFILADILEWEFLFTNDERFDIIVSNPPYITPAEKKDMHQNVLAFEPQLALFVESSAPLIFYDYISDFALKHLEKTGTLYFEINQYLSNETASLLCKKGFTQVQILKDINGVDRMISAKKL